MNSFSPNPADYQKQFHDKVNKIKQLLSPYYSNEIACFQSPQLNYRDRCEFKIWHQGDETHYAMFDREDNNKIHFIETFPIASKAINELMPKLKAVLKTESILRKKLFQIEFLSTRAGDMLVTLIYHKALNEEWRQTIQHKCENLGIKIVGRSKKQKLPLSDDTVRETFEVGDKIYHYKQQEGNFSQPNSSVCKEMLNWADSVLKIEFAQEKTSSDNKSNTRGDLLELYCGNGNFTLPLSQHFDKVLATEISKSLIKLALENCAVNDIDNIAFVKMSAEDISQAIEGVREFRRLKDIDLEGYDFSTVFVDPPRAGLDDATCNMVKKFDNILYISCNPETLLENLHTLCKTHTIKHAAFFDQFPYTHHMECGVYLSRHSN